MIASAGSNIGSSHPFVPTWDGERASRRREWMERRQETAPADAGQSRRLAAERYLLFLCFCLAGYALAGRGFAYVGVPPLYVGEVALLVGLLVLVRTRGWANVLQAPSMLCLLTLVVWCAARTVPFLAEYGADAMRDAAIYYYGGFAVITAALMVAEPRAMRLLFRRYRTFGRVFLIGIPVVFVIYHFGRDYLPRWPWSQTPVLFLKEGDVMVHLAGILAFWVAGSGGSSKPGWTLLLALDAAVMGVVDRAGLLAFLAVIGLSLAHRPRNLACWRLIAVGAAAIAVIWASGFHMEIPGGKGRELSFKQIIMNVTSMASDTGQDGMDSTKEWRMEWWKTIARETFHGPYFWGGRGFGINLADDDGFQVQADHSLRSPNSAYMTFLARAGVPGLVLFVVALLAWGTSVAGAYFQSRRTGDLRWEGVFFFLFAFWMALVINAGFDVFLEGPVGGIWFWTVFGAGVGALWIYQRRPEVLYQP